MASRKQPGQRFADLSFAADLFGFRCPILPMPDTAYWSDLFPGATDISFCDADDTFPAASPSFDEPFRRLLRAIVNLLERMRNQSSRVLVYPRSPPPELAKAHSALTRELDARSYRILPEDELDPARHVSRCKLAVLLLGAAYDETTRRLVTALADIEKPFVIWPSPLLERSGVLEQRGFFQKIIQLESGWKTLLKQSITPEKLKEEVFDILDLEAKIAPAAEDKQAAMALSIMYASSFRQAKVFSW